MWFPLGLAPQKLLVCSWIRYDFSVTDFDDRGGKLLYKVAIVRHKDERSAEVLQGIEQDVRGVNIEVICRLVEQKCVGGM